MKQAEISYKTKSALATALRVRLKQEEFKKISVRDLTEDCNVNRQTFYYHFKDIYDLLKWAIEEDIYDFIESQKIKSSWRDSLLIVFEYLQENRDLAINAYNSIGHEKFFSMMTEYMHDILNLFVRRYGEDYNIPEKSVEFIVSYSIILIAGIIESYLTGHLNYPPQEIYEMTRKMLDIQIAGLREVYGSK